MPRQDISSVADIGELPLGRILGNPSILETGLV